MDPELAALTSTAASTVVKLLATTAWEQAKTAVGELWQRVHPERVETVQAELDDARTEVLAARQAGDEQIERDVVREWHGRLRRLVAADSQVADDLRRLVTGLCAALAAIDSSPGTTVTLQATTFGKSRVNQAGHDLYITER